MLHAIALDDDPRALDLLRTFCQQLSTVTLSRTFSRPVDARHYLLHHRVDLVFLDINMPTESGLDFWQSIRAHGTDATATTLPMLILTTASSEYGVASYDLQATDYLLKPFSFPRFAQAIQKATDYAHWQQLARATPPVYLSLRVDAGLVRINTADITWIEALSNYLKIHLADQRFLVVRMTMKAILQALPATDFVRVHRSFIVAVPSVQAVHNKLIRIGDAQIPLSSHYSDAFYARVGDNPISSPFSTASSQTTGCLQQRYANVRNSP